MKNSLSQAESSPSEWHWTYRLGSLLVLVALAAVVLHSGATAVKWFIFACVTLLLVLGRRLACKVPFLFLVAGYLLLNVVGAFYIGTSDTVLLWYYAQVRADEITWLMIPLIGALAGAAMAEVIIPKFGPPRFRISSPPLFVLIPVWLVVLVAGVVLADRWDLGLSRILIGSAIPFVLFVVGQELRHHSAQLRLGWWFLAVVSVIPAFHLGARRYLVLFLVWGFFLSLLSPVGRSAGLARSAGHFWFLAVAMIASFVGLVNVKYGAVEDLGLHLANRVVFVHSHSSLVTKEERDAGRMPEVAGVGGRRYWLSLLPGFDKPISSGEYLYRLSRRSPDRVSTTPYLSPSLPAELYMTARYVGLVFGGGLVGILIAGIWSLTVASRRSSVVVVFGTGAVTFLCGAGSTALYGRINAIKELTLIVALSVALTLVFRGPAAIGVSLPRMRS